MCRGINEILKGYQLTTNLVEDEMMILYFSMLSHCCITLHIHSLPPLMQLCSQSLLNSH
jgi:hypothetical protein